MLRGTVNQRDNRVDARTSKRPSCKEICDINLPCKADRGADRGANRGANRGDDRLFAAMHRVMEETGADCEAAMKALYEAEDGDIEEAIERLMAAK